MKSVVFRGISGVWRPSRKGRGAVGTALVAASGVAALAFAPSAQAAGSYNVMLTKVPAGVRSVDLWDHTEDISVEVGCITVQPGRDKNTGYKISSGHYLVGEMYSRTECSGSHKGSTTSATVSNNLGTANFWFALN